VATDYQRNIRDRKKSRTLYAVHAGRIFAHEQSISNIREEGTKDWAWAWAASFRGTRWRPDISSAKTRVYAAGWCRWRWWEEGRMADWKGGHS